MPMCRKDIRSLKPGQWLNDEVRGRACSQKKCQTSSAPEIAHHHAQVINFYCGLMQERALRQAGEGQQPAVHYFPSFFYTTLTRSGYNYNAVRRWSTQKKLGGYDVLHTERIIVPINKVRAILVPCWQCTTTVP
jgi:sentrin-specific protease 1